MKHVTRFNDPKQNQTEIDLVPGIYKYCDRWCDLCHAKRRCALYIDQSARARVKEESDRDNLRLLIHVGQEEFGMGIDLDECSWSGEDTADCPLYSEYPGLRKFSADYLEDVIDWTQMYLGMMRDCSEAIECRNILCYYAFVIMSRIYMAEAVEGINEKADRERLGYAKVVQVSLGYSRWVWDIVENLADFTDDEISGMKSRVEKISEDLEKWIPGGKNFMRKGLDDRLLINGCNG